jgi:hypothetical protein
MALARADRQLIERHLTIFKLASLSELLTDLTIQALT